MTCPNKNQLGGCKLHNLHCGYPSCETHPSPEVAVKPPQYVVINGMRFGHSEILKWHERQTAIRDQHADDTAIDIFAQAMKNKMARMRERGRSGWDSKSECTEESLADMLVKELSKGDPVDVANFAMMLFTRGASDLTLSEAMLKSYVEYHTVIQQAQRKAKDMIGLVELPRMLVEIYIDMQHNASRYTVDRRVTTEERLLKLIEIKDETIKEVSSEF